MTARRALRLVVAGSILLGAVGCGGDVPPTGSQVVLPESYKQREKEIMDGFKAGMKKPGKTVRR